MKSVSKCSRIQIEDLEVFVVRKAIKNINLSICPPDGRVRVSAPHKCSDRFIREVIVSRLVWIKKRQALLQAQPEPVEIAMNSGEIHWVFGKRYFLDVRDSVAASKIRLQEPDALELYVAPGSDTAKRRKILDEWYRKQLHDRIPDLLKYWQPVIGVVAAEWRIKNMKTRWGSCNIAQKRIWLNLQLAKMSPECLEYVVVHELVHLLERYHNDRFRRLMDQFLPTWERSRELLKREPLLHLESSPRS